MEPIFQEIPLDGFPAALLCDLIVEERFVPEDDSYEPVESDPYPVYTTRFVSHLDTVEGESTLYWASPEGSPERWTFLTSSWSLDDDHDGDAALVEVAFERTKRRVRVTLVELPFSTWDVTMCYECRVTCEADWAYFKAHCLHVVMASAQEIADTV